MTPFKPICIFIPEPLHPTGKYNVSRGRYLSGSVASVTYPEPPPIVVPPNEWPRTNIIPLWIVARHTELPWITSVHVDSLVNLLYYEVMLGSGSKKKEANKWADDLIIGKIGHGMRGT